MIKTNWIYNCLLFRSTIIELEPDILQILGYTGEGMDGLIPHFLVFFISFGGSLWMLVIYIRVCWRICPQVWAPKRNPRWKTFPVFWETELSSNNIKKELYLRKYNPTLPSSRPKKTKKIHPAKNSLYFRKWDFVTLILKRFLYFLKTKPFLQFQKWNATLSTPSPPRPLPPPSPQKRTQPGKINLYFRKQKPQNIKR